MQTAKKKRIITISVAAALAAAMATVGAVLAVMTRVTESRANNFTFGNVNIELDEPNWDEEDNILYPGRTVSKDPTVENTGINDLYVYLEVSIPKKTIRIADGDTISEAKLQDLLICGEINTDWTLLSEDDSDSDYHTVLYVYNKMLKAKPSDAPDGYSDHRTTALFSEVTFVNAVEGEPEDAAFDMPITAYAIQAEYLSDEEIDPSDTEAFKAIMQNAFNKYLKETA
ncbi:MAG: hypothetical protein J1E39_09360 [Eubacterium sp.]|nr:hypothetical protein [Eubacterium sp.]